jgi:tetratricopeptide (TPR) repeat protein
VSPSPDNAARSGSYESGWLAINRLYRQGGSLSGHERKILYRNQGNGRFVDISSVAGLDFPDDGRAFASLDFDLDGDLDLVLVNRNSPQLRLLRNDGSEVRHSVAFRLEAKKGNRDAVGARLILEVAGHRFTKTVRSGSGFLSQPSRAVYFGLGEKVAPLRLTIHWPSGELQSFESILADQLIRITEGQNDFTSVPFHSRSQPRPDEGKPGAVPIEQVRSADEGEKGIWLTDPVPTPSFELRGLDGKTYNLESFQGHRILLNFWATWCAPCKAELSDLTRHRARIEAKGWVPLLVSVDEPGEEDKVRQYVKSNGLPWPVLFADEEMVKEYNILLRQFFDQATDLVIPTTFLVNESGETVKLYLGTTSADQIFKDSERMPRSRNELLSLAVPFPGQAFSTEFRRNWVSLADSFAKLGSWAKALAYAKHGITIQPDNPEAHDQLGLLYAKQGRWSEALEAHQKAIDLGLSDSAVYSHRAAALAHLGKLSEADTAAELAVKQDPESPWAIRIWAKIKAERGDRDEALSALQRSLAFDPEDPDAFYTLGLLHLRSSRLAEADEAFRRAVQLDPRHAEALNMLGVLCARKGNLDEARGLFGRALEARADFAEAHANLGLLYLQQRDWKQAEKSLQSALSARPNYADALNNLGLVYVQVGRLQEALPLFKRARMENPRLAQAYLAEAKALMEIGDRDRAISTLNDLLKIQPQDPTALEWLSQMSKQSR